MRKRGVITGTVPKGNQRQVSIVAQRGSSRGDEAAAFRIALPVDLEHGLHESSLRKQGGIDKRHNVLGVDGPGVVGGPREGQEPQPKRTIGAQGRINVRQRAQRIR